MTYCVAISLEAGLVFASDSRTNAGVDQVSTYSKMHIFDGPGRQFVLLSAGNLATTQAVLAQLRRDRERPSDDNLDSAGDMAEAAEYLGKVSRSQEDKHGEAVAKAGFSADATFIIGGQIEGESPQIYLVYPQGNYITTSQRTRFLQVGETKYGKAILDRIIQPDMSLEDAALCALVSVDSTMRSNAGVGPPVELLTYKPDSFQLGDYLSLAEDDPYLLTIKRSWNAKITQAFRELPGLTWGSIEAKCSRG